MTKFTGYQVMPRLTQEEYEELEQDIIENGVLVPIVTDNWGRIVDGHHRDEIARKHDLHCPRTKVSSDPVKLRSMAFSLNLHRRHLDYEAKRELAAGSIKADPLLPNAEHARRTGLDPKTVKSIREEAGVKPRSEQIADYVAEHPEKSAREVARDLGVSPTTASEAVQKREIPENGHSLTDSPEDVTQLEVGIGDAPEPEADVPPAPVAEEPEEDSEPAILAPLEEALVQLIKTANKIKEITEDERFDPNDAAVAARVCDIEQAITTLQSAAQAFNH